MFAPWKMGYFDFLALEHFLLIDYIAPLLGLVPGARCQILAGTQAPVAPALTKALSTVYISSMMSGF